MIELLAAAAVSNACSWDRPGHRPFTGNVPSAVQVYTDIPAPVRARLQARMTARTYDEIVQITRDSITGKHAYSPDITGMHFGAGQVCGTVTRAKWSDKMVERGLVYCEEGRCILVPTVCRNVSRITRLPPTVGIADAGALPADPAPVVPTAPADVQLAAAPLAPYTAPTVPVDSAAPEGSFSAGAAQGGSIYGGAGVVWFGPGLPVSIPAHTPTVPWPESWALLVAGLAITALRVKK